MIIQEQQAVSDVFAILSKSPAALSSQVVAATLTGIDQIGINNAPLTNGRIQPTKVRILDTNCSTLLNSEYIGLGITIGRLQVFTSGKGFITMKNREQGIKTGVSTNTGEIKAIQELSRMISQPDGSGILFFCSSKYDLKRLAVELKKHFAEPIIGCTTAGEITPLGLIDSSITGVSFPSNSFKITPYPIAQLDKFSLPKANEIAESINSRLKTSANETTGTRAFGILLIDGLSQMEERVLAYLSKTLVPFPIFGGSAADDLRFKQTSVFNNGQFMTNAGVLVVVETNLPFKVFKTQHFVATDKKFVITDADPDQRLVREINGEPAAWEYARLIGMEVEELTPMIFSKYPVMLKIGGEYYVRSVMQAHKNASLTFACAIDNGLVLTIAKGIDLFDNLNEAFTNVNRGIENTQLILGCDCAWRKIEIHEKEITNRVGRLYTDNNVIGFCTYGEQYNSIHINQTFTGVAIGS